MKTLRSLLMFKDHDANLQQQPRNENDLIQDLGLTVMFDAMARGDEFVREVVRKAVLSSLDDPDAIHYRQAILKDCLEHPSMTRKMYDIATGAIQGERNSYFGLGYFMRNSPDSIASRSRGVLEWFASQLRKLRAVADAYADKVASSGLQTLFATLRRELDDAYLAEVEAHLHELQFRNGVLISARLGKGNGGTDYVLHRRERRHRGWLDLIPGRRLPVYTFYLHPRDEGGAMILLEMKGRALNLVANALAQSVDHVRSFLTTLRTELAFYVGCLNLYETLSELGQPICFPVPVARDRREHTLTGLYDACLVLTMRRGVVGNDLHADGKDLAIITGANRGGKSTFLRSIGLAQLMMQCGMFVPAESFRANVCSGLFTHFKRAEDATMKSGKLDEEFRRMSAIADQIRSNGLVLFNESFAATNEREGAEIASQIIRALVDSRIKVFVVTHMYELARRLFEQDMENVLFLRAERKSDGTRTFRIIEGEPLQTGHGQDLYDRIFGVRSSDDR